MSETLQRAPEPLTTANRRLHVRLPFLSIAYVELGEGNGGVIANISEGGLAVQAAMALVEDSLPCIRFQLGPAKYRVQTRARVTWKSDSKKSAGLQFQDLPEEARAKISEYISFAAGVSDEYFPPKEASRKKPPPQDPGASKPEIVTPLQPAPQPALPPASALPSAGGETPMAAATAPSATMAPSTAKTSPDARAPVWVPQAPGTEASPAGASASAPARSARTRLKRYLVNERARILLHDFTLQETEKLCAQLTEQNFPSATVVSGEECLRRMHRYEQLCEVLIAVISTGCFWGEKHQEAIWAKLLERVANAASPTKIESEWRDLSSYPALLLLYAGGVAAVAKDKYSTLATLLSAPQFRDARPEAHVVQRLNPLAVLGTEKIAKLLYEQMANSNGYDGLCKACPGNAYLHALLRDPLREFLPFDSDYDEAFDRFEYSLALIWTDENPQSANLDWFPLVPLGRFACLQASSAEGEPGFIERVGAEILGQGKNSPLLHAGLFGGSLHRLTTAKKLIEVSVAYSRYAVESRTDGPGSAS
jgi:PilZ domain-containing protein